MSLLPRLRESSETTKGLILPGGYRIGEAAGVVVDKKDGKTSYASAHDLRRSFGLRWSRRVMPPVLQELMRHESIQTTMKFYVGQDAQLTAAELHRAIGQTRQNESVGNLWVTRPSINQMRAYKKSRNSL